MSRSNQYIGLTRKAQNYVSAFESLEQLNALRGNELNPVVEGMFHEEMPMGIWKHPEGGIIKEVVQEICFSGGAMVFTLLSWDMQKQREIIDGKDVMVADDISMYEWVHSPAVKDMEFDTETGEFWI